MKTGCAVHTPYGLRFFLRLISNIRIFQYKMKSFFLHKRVITKNAYGDYKVVFSEKTVITKTENERDEKSFLKAIA